jgi:bifunctional non-homologous end joining protein LigD
VDEPQTPRTDEPLAEYRARRDFSKTPEPAPQIAEGGGNRFVVQEHHASHLHWDFRLEHEGVLASWAIPKGPPEQPGVRRLAVRTEDHPVSYIDFEGSIPEGEYGAGTVIIWDRGTYEAEEWTDKTIAFTLDGQRLQGRYVLIHTGDDNWIMLKRKAQ